MKQLVCNLAHGWTPRLNVRRAREYFGLSVSQMCAVLSFSERWLRCIEKNVDPFKMYGGDGYFRGFPERQLIFWLVDVGLSSSSIQEVFGYGEAMCESDFFGWLGGEWGCYERLPGSSETCEEIREKKFAK